MSHSRIFLPWTLFHHLSVVVCLSLFSIVTLAAENRAPAPAPAQTKTFSPDELAQYPAIVFQGLSQAVMKADSKGVALLLPVYQRQPSNDPALVDWAKAILEKSQGNYKKAISFYRKVIATHPQLELARLQLAITLLQNRDNDSALNQFNKLRSNGNDAQLQAVVEQYISLIQSIDRFSFSAGVNYLNERNINNAPAADTRIGLWLPDQQESGQGFSYFLSGQKSWSLPYGLFSESRGVVFGRYFTNNHRYDELQLRLASGIGYRNVDFSVLGLPFIEYNWLSWNEAPSLSLAGTRFGLRLESEYRLTNQWKTSTAVEFSRNEYRQWSWRDSNNYLLDESIFYFLNSQEYWFIGVRYGRENAELKTYSFSLSSLYGGWGREWNNGLSTLIQPSYSYKRYDDKDFFLIRQESNQYNLLVTFWHRDIYFVGITPRVNIQYTRNDSNHPFYQYDKTNVFLTFSRSF